MRDKKKVVIDTNIFVKGWYSENKYCNIIMDMIDNRKLQLFFSQDTIGELVYIIKGFARRYYKNKSDSINDLKDIMELFYYGTTVNTSHTKSPEINDKYDDIFLKCAIEGDANYLISDDFKSGMHDINKFGFKVLNSKDFCKMMEECNVSNVN